MKFNEEELKRLKQNQNVLKVVNDRIYYTKSFKEQSITEYLQGKSARQIFIDAGFNLQEISTVPDYASRIMSKWRKTKTTKNNIYYPKKKIKENKTNYQKMQSRLEYLEAENEFLKKLSALCDKYRD